MVPGLRVAMVVPPYFSVPPTGYGGIEAVVGSLVDELVARGHEVTVIGAGRGGHRGRHVATFEEPLADRVGERLPEVLHAAVAEVELRRLDVDVVHDHTVAGLLSARGRPWPTVVTAHGAVTGEVGRLYGAVGDSIHLVAVSDAQRRLAPGLPWVHRVHHGVDLGDWPYVADKGDYAVFLGRIVPKKGPGLAIEAARRAGVPLVIAGKVGDEQERRCFEEQVAPHLGPGVSWFGPADSAAKRRLLGGARCLLFPVQWEEPFGMVLLEAAAVGTPVVALGSGAVPEIVEDSVTGFVAQDLDGLVDALRRVPTLDPANCRRRVQRHFRVDQMAAGYERVYGEVLTRRRGRPPPWGTPSVAGEV